MSLSSTLIEVTLSFVSQKRELEFSLIQFLKDSKFLRQEIVQTRDGCYNQLRVYVSKQMRARRLENDLKKIGCFSHVLFQCRLLSRHDWADKWKEDYHIQALGKRFVIVPTWRRKEFNSKKFKRRVPVWIDPLSAFGSGEHETTQLIVRQIERLSNRFESFLDIGTGTGILSIVAKHCGATRILGFDRDKPSAECARMNFNINGLETGQTSFVRAELSGFAYKPLFDLVCANINSHILESYRKEIVRSASVGGWVLVSGILKETYISFRENFDGPDLRCLKILKGRRWVSVLYKKQN